MGVLSWKKYLRGGRKSLLTTDLDILLLLKSGVSPFG